MPTRIIDTVVLIAFSAENDPLNVKASEYMFEVGIGKDMFVPSATLLEFDLELKTHGIEDKDREKLHSNLKRLIPTNRVLPLTPSVLERASQRCPT